MRAGRAHAVEEGGVGREVRMGIGQGRVLLAGRDQSDPILRLAGLHPNLVAGDIGRAGVGLGPGQRDAVGGGGGAQIGEPAGWLAVGSSEVGDLPVGKSAGVIPCYIAGLVRGLGIVSDFNGVPRGRRFAQEQSYSGTVDPYELWIFVSQDRVASYVVPRVNPVVCPKRLVVLVQCLVVDKPDRIPAHRGLRQRRVPGVHLE